MLRLLQTDIISQEYLDGGDQLEQHGPDLGAGIVPMCGQGRSPAK